MDKYSIGKRHLTNLKYKDGILSGDCLLLVWDDCNCDQCENEL